MLALESADRAATARLRQGDCHLNPSSMDTSHRSWSLGGRGAVKAHSIGHCGAG